MVSHGLKSFTCLKLFSTVVVAEYFDNIMMQACAFPLCIFLVHWHDIVNCAWLHGASVAQAPTTGKQTFCCHVPFLWMLISSVVFWSTCTALGVQSLYAPHETLCAFCPGVMSSIMLPSSKIAGKGEGHFPQMHWVTGLPLLLVSLLWAMMCLFDRCSTAHGLL